MAISFNHPADIFSSIVTSSSHRAMPEVPGVQRPRLEGFEAQELSRRCRRARKALFRLGGFPNEVLIRIVGSLYFSRSLRMMMQVRTEFGGIRQIMKDVDISRLGKGYFEMILESIPKSWTKTITINSFNCSLGTAIGLVGLFEEYRRRNSAPQSSLATWLNSQSPATSWVGVDEAEMAGQDFYDFGWGDEGLSDIESDVDIDECYQEACARGVENDEASMAMRRHMGALSLSSVDSAWEDFR